MTPGNSTSPSVTPAKVGNSLEPFKDVLLVTSSRISTAPSLQYTHLRATVLGYAHINLISMLSRFTQDEAVRVATDSMSRKRRSINSRESKSMWLPGSAAAGSTSASPASLMSRATTGCPLPVALQKRADLLAQGACGQSPRAGIQSYKKGPHSLSLAAL